MPPDNPAKASIKPTDLRGILEYVPLFRDHVFVIALDGSLVDHPNFQNVLLDIAVLRSLNIKVVLTYGIGQQLKALSKSREIPITDAYGEYKTDARTLKLAVEASAMVSSTFMQGLTRNGLRCALTNAVRSKEIGILKGEDQLYSGTVDKLDVPFINHLLSADTIPVVAPLGSSPQKTATTITPTKMSRKFSTMPIVLERPLRSIIKTRSKRWRSGIWNLD